MLFVVALIAMVIVLILAKPIVRLVLAIFEIIATVLLVAIGMVAGGVVAAAIGQEAIVGACFGAIGSLFLAHRQFRKADPPAKPVRRGSPARPAIILPLQNISFDDPAITEAWIVIDRVFGSERHRFDEARSACAELMERSHLLVEPEALQAIQLVKKRLPELVVRVNDCLSDAEPAEQVSLRADLAGDILAIGKRARHELRKYDRRRDDLRSLRNHIAAQTRLHTAGEF